MPEPFSGSSEVIDAEWVLRQVPVISYFCENDGLYTMRWLNAGGGNDLGYNLQDFVDNKHYFAASAVHPDDLDVVDQFAERALASRRPIIARYRLVHVGGEVMPMLLAARAVRDRNGQPQGFCGMVLNIAQVPQLHGPSQVLTDPGAPREQPGTPVSDHPGVPDPAWVDTHAPAVTFAVEVDESYTLRHGGGQARFFLDYPTEQFLDNARYRPSNSVLPEDIEVTDETFDLCAANPGAMIVNRYHLVHSQGHPVPGIYAYRGVLLGDRAVVVGVGLDISDCPALKGKSCILKRG
ncbi:MAG: PAS domain-containing protein [Planctomycetes bacterium]|nr:PAS domain-containing protein [Planctomycetota bacterium]